MYLDDVFEIILENDNKLLRYYRHKILNNFKKNSKSTPTLSERQYCIMYLIIYRNINKVTELAQFMDLSKANISILVSKLVDNKFLVRQKNEDSDSRVTILAATDEGRDAFNQIRECLVVDVNILIDKGNSFENVVLEFAKILENIFYIDTKPDNIQDFIIFVAIRINRYYENMYSNLIKQNGLDLSVSEIRIIKTLGLNGSLNFEALADVMGISDSTLSLQVKNLQDRDYITKQKSEIDGRIMYLTLSENGIDINNRLKTYKREIIHKRLEKKTELEFMNVQKTLLDIFSLFDSFEG